MFRPKLGLLCSLNYLEKNISAMPTLCWISRIATWRRSGFQMSCQLPTPLSPTAAIPSVYLQAASTTLTASTGIFAGIQQQFDVDFPHLGNIWVLEYFSSVELKGSCITLLILFVIIWCYINCLLKFQSNHCSHFALLWVSVWIVENRDSYESS